ncbi:Uncharacterised protein [Shigella sonnei]|nr:Uncharacterised protein [Shigella sonnei]
MGEGGKHRFTFTALQAGKLDLASRMQQRRGAAIVKR